MKAISESGYITIEGPFPIDFLKTLSLMNGRKIWSQSKYVRIDGSPWNVKRLKECDFPIEWEDKSGELKEIEGIQQLLKDYGKELVEIKSDYKPKYELKEHQKKALNQSCERSIFAYFIEMGLGKTALTIANFCILFLEKKVEGVIIVAPKGPHKQWLAEELPKHIDDRIPLNMTLWTVGKYYRSDELKVNGKLNIFSINIDSLNTEAGAFAVNQFINLFYDKCFMVVDESHKIMNYSAYRSKMVIALGEHIKYKRILTGTPIGVSLVNIWSQFMFLDYRIIGIQYITAFKARYMGINPWSGKPEERNVEEFYSLIAPHMFRITKKECTDLPDKIYATKIYQLGKVAMQHYENMKFSFMTKLASGEEINAKNALAAMTRLQQICSGFLPRLDDEGEKIGLEVFTYERAEFAFELVEEVDGPVIIWTRFIQDIESLKHIFNKKYRGEIATINTINDFKIDKKRFLFMNSAKGEGWDLPKKGGCTEIFYNNSFNYIHRIQSEDRAHRLGMEGSLTIFDICADKTIDSKITDNLKNKKDISKFVLDDIRQMVI